MPAKLTIHGGNLKVKKLDINSGFGPDMKGILL